MKKLGRFIKDLFMYIAIQVLMIIFFIIGIFNKEQGRLFLGNTIK